MKKKVGEKMNHKLLSGLFYTGMSIVGLGAFGMVVATALSINAFFPESGRDSVEMAPKPLAHTEQGVGKKQREVQPQVQGAPPQASRRVQIAGGVVQSPAAENHRALSLEAATGEPGSTAELDRAFSQFLEDQGLPAVDLRHHPAPVVSDPGIPEIEDPVSRAAQKQFAAATQTLKEDYAVTDARRQKNGEVWIRVDPSETTQSAVDEMMARAAELYGDASEPLKVVVWAGNRMRAVKTYNGEQIF
jgi:hypothetical protein